MHVLNPYYFKLSFVWRTPPVTGGGCLPSRGLAGYGAINRTFCPLCLPVKTLSHVVLHQFLPFEQHSLTHHWRYFQNVIILFLGWLGFTILSLLHNAANQPRCFLRRLH